MKFLVVDSHHQRFRFLLTNIIKTLHIFIAQSKVIDAGILCDTLWVVTLR